MARLITISCPTCDGTGRLSRRERGTTRRDARQCPDCAGTGTVMGSRDVATRPAQPKPTERLRR
jgi:DnaJ-class molecular chaperone